MNSKYRTIVVVALAMLFLTVPLAGQSHTKKSWWYGFFGAGAETKGYIEDNYWHVGGGYEALIKEGLGVGIELGRLSFPNYSGRVLLISPGVLYAFNRDEKTRPFVTGGYTHFSYDESGSNGGFLGGGINRFWGERWGMRIEFRDYIASNKWITRNYVEGRIGLFF